MTIRHRSSTACLAKLRKHYNSLTYQALLNATRSSLNTVKKRMCSRAGSGFLFVQRPFFAVDVQLSVPSVRLSPSLDDVQRAINLAAVAVLGCSKKMFNWNQRHLPEAERRTFFDILGCDREIIKVALLLTGALHGTKNQVYEHLQTFRKYDWLWQADKDQEYRGFVARNPNVSISDYEGELQRFMTIEQEISRIPPMHNIGALTLNTSNLKLQLSNESRQWKMVYAAKVHSQAKELMFNLLEYMRATTAKLKTEVTNLEQLRYVMVVLREIRERESSIEMEITPILDMYQMLEAFLPGNLVDKDEMDQKAILRSSWKKVIDRAEVVTDTLSAVQGQYKKQLIVDVKAFATDVKAFRADFERDGPMVAGIAPLEAVDRLRGFKDALLTRERRAQMYADGEELFALRPTKHADLIKTKKEVVLLDQLYNLYVDVLKAGEGYRAVLWAELPPQLDAMVETVASFDARCKKLPRRLREWEAYVELKAIIGDFTDVLPIFEGLCKPSIKSRHWVEVCECTGTQYKFDKEMFSVADVIDSPILTVKEEVEEVCDGADKQLGIETKLGEVKEQWARAPFTFKPWKTRGVPEIGRAHV